MQLWYCFAVATTIANSASKSFYQTNRAVLVLLLSFLRKAQIRAFDICYSETFAVAGLATATPRESVKPAIVDGKEDANTKNSVATAKSRSKTSTIRPKRAASTRRKLPPVKKSDTPNDTTNTNERK